MRGRRLRRRLVRPRADVAAPQAALRREHRRLRALRVSVHAAARRDAVVEQVVLDRAVVRVGLRGIRDRGNQAEGNRGRRSRCRRPMLTIRNTGPFLAVAAVACAAAWLAVAPIAPARIDAPAVHSALRWETGTFSILGYDPATGEVGGAVQSRVFSVGNGVLWAEANVGVVATQAIVDVSYGPQSLELLRRGMAPSAILRTVLDHDPDPLPDGWTKQGRQFAVMNGKGEYAAYTGPKATPWAGNKSGKYCTAQGNIL